MQVFIGLSMSVGAQVPLQGLGRVLYTSPRSVKSRKTSAKASI